MSEPNLLFYQADKKLYIRSFFADNDFNQNKWRVTQDALNRDIASGVEKDYFGKTAPMIDTPQDGHPPDETEDMITEQEQYRKGDFIRTGIDSKSKRAFVDAVIYDAKTIERIQNGELNYVSPSIRALEEIHSGSTITVPRFKINHLAFVKKPAYGELKAQIRGRCSGTEEECLPVLANIQAETKVGIMPCGGIQINISAESVPDYIKEKIKNKDVITIFDVDDMMKDKQGENNEPGEWKTIKGHRIFFPDGIDPEKVIKTHFDKVEKEQPEKNTNKIIISYTNLDMEQIHRNKEEKKLEEVVEKITPLLTKAVEEAREGMKFPNRTITEQVDRTVKNYKEKRKAIFGEDMSVDEEQISSIVFRSSIWKNLLNDKNMKDKQGDKGDTHKCEDCGKMFPNQDSLDEHYKKDHNAEDSSEQINQTKDYGAEEKTWHCDQCNKDFTDKTEIKKHTEQHIDHRLRRNWDAEWKQDQVVAVAYAKCKEGDHKSSSIKALKGKTDNKNSMTTEEEQKKIDEEKKKKEQEDKMDSLETSNKELKAELSTFKAVLDAEVKSPIVNKIVQTRLKAGSLKEADKQATTDALMKNEIAYLKTMENDYSAMIKHAEVISKTQSQPLQTRFSYSAAIPEAKEEVKRVLSHIRSRS